METIEVTLVYKELYTKRPYFVMEALDEFVTSFVRADFEAREIECLVETALVKYIKEELTCIKEVQVSASI